MKMEIINENGNNYNASHHHITTAPQVLNNRFAALPPVVRNCYQYYRRPFFLNFIAVSVIALFPSVATAAVKSTITKSTITGTAPYLTFDDGMTKAIDTAALHTITLTDGRSYTQTNNLSTPTDPIELPAYGQTFADVKMFIPTTTNRVTLSELINAPNNFFGDDDGDGAGSNGISATGSLTLKIVDSTGKIVNRGDSLPLCSGVTHYRVTLNSTAGSLKTQYGNPRTTPFTETSTTYYLKPKPPTKPYVCYAQPNLKYSGINKGILTGSDYGNWDGPVSQWDNKKGFFLQNLDQPSANFPTVGAYGLFFNLVMTQGANWADISYDKSPSNSGIDIEISNGNSGSTTNVAKLFLTGPRYNTNNATTAVPTTFTIYSDRAKTNKIYSFTINKWFIATPGDGNGYKADYCSNRYGGNYRIPNVKDYTNGSGNGWTSELAGQPRNYQRRIGGGLLAEWGNMCNTSSSNCKSIYNSLDFDYWWYWASETDSPNQSYVYLFSGYVSYHTASYRYGRHACVTP